MPTTCQAASIQTTIAVAITTLWQLINDWILSCWATAGLARAVLLMSATTVGRFCGSQTQTRSHEFFYFFFFYSALMYLSALLLPRFKTSKRISTTTKGWKDASFFYVFILKSHQWLQKKKKKTHTHPKTNQKRKSFFPTPFFFLSKAMYVQHCHLYVIKPINLQ